MSRYVLTAGGTGGHIFPARSLAKQLEKDGHSVLFLTDRRGDQYTKYFKTSSVLDLRHRKGYLGKFLLICDLMKETLRVISFYKKLQPDIVIGFGGYPSVPGVLAAQLLRIPTIIHEQNTIMGKANRILSRFAYKVVSSFEDTKKTYAKPVFIGNPVRQEFFDVTPYKVPENHFNIFIVGGSQGSHTFSKIVPATLKKLSPEEQKKISVLQQCREGLIEETQKNYEGFLGKVALKTFFDNMPECYEKSHLIVSRSGGSTVAELCATGRPAFLVPFAASLEGDQMNNALYLKNKNAALLCTEYLFTTNNFLKVLNEIMENPKILNDLAKNAKALSNASATENIVKLIYEVAA